MPKHIPSDHYFNTPHKPVPNATIHPEVEHHDHPADAEHYMLPVVFHLDKGKIATGKYPGPGVFYLSEGEVQYEDTKKPGNPTVITAGSVVHIEEGSVLRWHSHSTGKGFAAFYVPVSIKSVSEFIVSE